jgi:hypothetical protein
MKRPRLRFTMRRLMIAVAIIALSMGAARWVVVMRARSIAHYQRANDFARMMARAGSSTHTADGRVIDLYDNENYRIIDAWACPLARKYWRLSDYPWLPVEPDPPYPMLLDYPKGARDLPAKVHSGCWIRKSKPPAWTFLWTRRL